MSSRRPKRTLFRSVRLTPGELSILKVKAQAAGLSVSEFLRRSAFGKEVRARRTAPTMDLVHHLSKIGANVNQLAHAANVARQVVARQRLERTLAALDEILEDLRR